MSKIPTIAMIPSAYKANKVYSVLPTNGDADLDFARTSTRTRVNEIGLIEDLATGVPALDYSDGGCPSLLLEPQSTNLITYSEDFSDSSWGKFDALVSSNIETSPKGDLTSDKFIENTGSSIKRLNTSLTITSGNSYTASLFVKADEREFILLRNNNGTTDLDTFFNVSLGTVISGNGVIEGFGNGWYRVSQTFTATSTVTSSFLYQVLLSTDGSTTSYTGDGTSGIYIWGAQLEQQSYPTSYIPTSGATATRVAETLSKTGLSNYINSSEGVLYAEISALADDLTYRGISITSTDNLNKIRIYFSNVSNQVRVFITENGSLQTITINLVDITDFFKIAVSYKSGVYKTFINGIQYGGLTLTGLTGTLSELRLDNGGGGENFYGKVKDLRVYNQALTDTELQNLTS